MRSDHDSRRPIDGQTSRPGDPRVARPARLRDRVLARLLSRSFDLALADGMPPEQNAAVALRARRLIDPCERRSIADALRRAVRESREGASRRWVRIPMCWPRVAAAGEELDELADALSRPGPVAVHGVAEALILLTDGSGPLYNVSSPASLKALAAAATADLQLDDGSLAA
ncbi:MAG: hypothetical protein M3018_01075 [Actinomycetota bacterium]|nr:hypothetical protein [Actinomycetota bacterium]